MTDKAYLELTFALQNNKNSGQNKGRIPNNSVMYEKIAEIFLDSVKNLGLNCMKPHRCRCLRTALTEAESEILYSLIDVQAYARIPPSEELKSPRLQQPRSSKPRPSKIPAAIQFVIPEARLPLKEYFLNILRIRILFFFPYATPSGFLYH